MKPLSVIALGLLLLGPIGFAGADEKKDDNAAKLVGKWELVKSDGEGVPVGAIVEFTKDGKLIVTATVNGQELKFEGTYKVEKDKLLTEIKTGENTSKDTDTIKKLTADMLELEDKDNKVTVLKKKK